MYALSALKYLAGTLSKDEERMNKSALNLFRKDLDRYIGLLDKKRVLATRINRSLDAVWHLGEVQLNTLISSVSLSQSRKNSEIAWVCPELSPFFQMRCLEREK